MASLPEGFAELKQRLRATWMAGDFGEIAKLNFHGAEEFIERLHLKPGTKVLDVACGTGNQSIPAARAGAEVIGLDIATNLLEQARKRAADEKLKIEFVEGDAEKLPATRPDSMSCSRCSEPCSLPGPRWSRQNCSASAAPAA